MCSFLFGLVLLIAAASDGLLQGQQTAEEPPKDRAQSSGAANSSREPCFSKKEAQTSEQRETDALASIPASFRFWLTEDAAYVISPEERCAFLHLGSDQQRRQFVDQFWYRRASDPESLNNDYKQEHYRRIVFANKKFGPNPPGWQTDRGRIYITFGPPDAEWHSDSSQRESVDGREARERWHYRYIEGLGENIDLEFVDSSRTGDFRLATPVHAKVEPPWNLPGLSTLDRAVAADAVQKIVMYVGPEPAPKVKMKDLEAMVVARITRDQVKFSYSVGFTRATHASTLARIVVKVPTAQLTFRVNDDEAQAGGAAIFGRISKPSGWVVETFERTCLLDAGRSAEPEPDPNREVTLPLEPGTYHLAIAIKDVASGEAGLLYTTLHVPSYDELDQP
jgi:GWxTD domain-containing protein